MRRLHRIARSCLERLTTAAPANATTIVKATSVEPAAGRPDRMIEAAGMPVAVVFFPRMMNFEAGLIVPTFPRIGRVSINGIFGIWVTAPAAIAVINASTECGTNTQGENDERQG
jgi:hypothetical protein